MRGKSSLEAPPPEVPRKSPGSFNGGTHGVGGSGISVRVELGEIFLGTSGGGSVINIQAITY